jgi:Na+/melibiose symporter-like transporter
MTTYSVGTLKYNKLQLCLLFGYLLMGGFTYCMLAYTLIPTLLPLTLDSFGASGAIIGLVVGSIPAGMNMVMNPILGTNSDRCRTRWGRRIPFLAFATPFVTVFMILIGWMPQFMDFIKNNAWIKPENANIIGIS